MKKYTQGSVVIVVLIAVVVGAVAGGGFYFMQNQPTPTAQVEGVTQNNESRGDFLSIISPTHSDTLEPGKPFTVSFTPVKNADSYEITISAPSYTDRTKNLINSSERAVLLKEKTKNTSHTITVPESPAHYLNETSYNGETLVVRALDKNGNPMNAVSESVFHGKKVTSEKPAVDSKQIKILVSPTDPKLLNADKLVVDRTGGTVTLQFGALPAGLASRKVSVSCYGPKVTLESIVCPEGSFTAGKEAFTKTMTIGPNTFPDRDTSISFRVQYYDAAGKEPNSSGIDDETFLSIKVRR